MSWFNIVLLIYKFAVVVEEEVIQPTGTGSIRLPRGEPRIDGGIPFGHHKLRRYTVAQDAVCIFVRFFRFAALHPGMDPARFRHTGIVHMTVQTVCTAGIVGHDRGQSVFIVEEAGLTIEVLHLLEQFGMRARLMSVTVNSLEMNGRISSMIRASASVKERASTR